MIEIILGIGSIFLTLLNVYIWVIIIAALITWVNPDPRNQLVQILYRLSEPAYSFVRRYIPTIFNGIDLAPLIIIIILQVVMLFLKTGLSKLAY
jgi:YggT family protein